MSAKQPANRMVLQSGESWRVRRRRQQRRRHSKISAMAQLRATHELTSTLLEPLGIPFALWLDWGRKCDNDRKVLISRLIQYLDKRFNLVQAEEENNAC